MTATLTVQELVPALRNAAPASVYLVTGEEDLLRDEAVAILKRAALGSEGGDFNCDVFYGDEAGGTEVLTCASEIPVFAERRLVLLKAADKLSAKSSEPLLGYLKEPNPTTTLVFVAPKLDGRLKFSQALSKAAVTVDCSPLRDGQLEPWVKAEAERLGVRLDEEAVHLLKELCGESLYTVRRELEKLAAYVPAGRAATAGDVEALRGTEPGASVFDLTLAIGAGDRRRALSILARNLEAGEAPLRILGSLAWQYRRLWKVKEALAGGGREGEAARTLRMDPYKIRAFVGRFTQEHLDEALRLFLDTDAKLKGGSGTQAARILEQVLLRLCRLVPSGSTDAPAGPVMAQAKPAGGRRLPNVRTIRSGKRPTS